MRSRLAIRKSISERVTNRRCESTGHLHGSMVVGDERPETSNPPWMLANTRLQPAAAGAIMSRRC